MTQGARPQFADTPYAQWIKKELDKRDWRKKELNAAVLAADDSGRLGPDGAEALVRRATHGHNLSPANRELLEKVLGHPPNGDHPAPLEAEVLRLTRDVRRLTRRVAVLERQAPPATKAEGNGR